MKIAWLSIIPLVALASCNSADPAMEAIMADSAAYTSIGWVEKVKHFDTLDRGGQATITFRFRNTGSKPLYLTEVRASCGCTVPDFTHGAIPPGAEGAVTGAFSSGQTQPGEVTKELFVVSNTGHGIPDTLIFTGVIREKK